MSPQRKPSRGKPSRDRAAEHSRGLEPSTLRIIGGRLRGSRLLWSGEARTRPMKDRVRQAMFDLIGPSIRGTHAIDLFAGSGALALEAISRGAVRATLLERHFPTAKIIEQNIAALALREIARVIAADTFVWAQALPDLGSEPWAVFCSPPYQYYQRRLEDMLQLVQTFLDQAPRASIVALEADHGLDISRLPQANSWMVRAYPPAIIAIHRSPTDT